MNWQLASLVIVGIAVLLGIGWYERSRPTTRIIAAVSVLAALAVLGRIAFAPIPNVKPTTDIILIAGYCLGGAPGFAVGATAALASNFVMGQGPWTPWQMAAWGLVGLIGAALGRLSSRGMGRISLALICGLCGLLFGAIMDLSTWLTFSSDLDLDRYLAIAATSLPFNVAHAAGNVVFFAVFGPTLVKTLERFRQRSEIEWSSSSVLSSGAVSALIATVVLAGSALGASPANAATPLDYIKASQNSDGGFGAAPGQSSVQLYTGWVALGIAAAGENPIKVTQNGRSVIDYIKSQSKQLNDIGELERTVLVLNASGLNPRRFEGRDLIAEILKQRKSDGSIGGLVNSTAFAAMALRSSGFSARSSQITRAAAWIGTQQRSDGGFNFAGRQGASDIDTTAAVLEGLASMGKRNGRVAKRAVSYLRKAQNEDGGFPLGLGDESNAQSTAWAVQALLASKVEIAGLKRGSPITYLEGLTAQDGSVQYSPSSKQTPVWVTGQALAALEQKFLPLAKVKATSAGVGYPSLLASAVGALANVTTRYGTS